MYYYDNNKWLCDKALSIQRKLYSSLQSTGGNSSASGGSTFTNNAVETYLPHPVVAYTLFVKGEILRGKKRPEYSLPLYEAALTICKQVYATSMASGNNNVS